MLNNEREITHPTLLCKKDGTLNKESIGWARRPHIIGNVSGNFSRKKKWNYWCVFGRDALFSATISHLDYASVCFIYYLEYETKRFFEKTVVVPFNRKVNMPDGVMSSVEAVHKNLSLFFVTNDSGTLLKVSCPDFNGEYLEADIRMTYPAELDTLNVVVPWSTSEFQYTAKHHCLPAEGYVKVGTEKFTFKSDTDYGVLDYGRGVWPRESSWNWGMASGNQDNDIIGINFGGKWTDGTGSTENAVFWNNKIYKISEDVTFIYDTDDYMKDWKIQSENVALTFEPFFERVAATNVILVKSEVHQMVGYYSGEIQLGDKTLKIDRLLGCIEEHYAKW